MRANLHSQSAKPGQIIQMSRSLLPGVVVRESSLEADKIDLKIYLFAIDYPIVLKGKYF